MIHTLRLPAALILIALGSSCTRPSGLKETDSKGTHREAADTKKTGKRETASETGAVQHWVFSKTNGSRLEFTNGKGINTGLEDLRYIGQLSNGNRAPFLLYAGHKAKDSTDSRHIYIYSPDQPLSDKLVRYIFPGTFKANGRLSSRSRAFLGQVLDDREGLLYYQEQFLDDNSTQKTAFSVSVDNGHLKHTLLRDTAKIRETLRLLKEGKCTELESVNVSATIP